MFHHNPGAANRFPVETAIIHLADIVAHSMLLGSSGERFVPPLDEQAWESLGISLSALAVMEDQIERLYEDALITVLGEAAHA
jgi:hypothetical protein